MGRVTLVGSLLAQPGAEYVFEKRCEVADRCPVAAPCQNLTVGRRYKVLSLRPAKHNVCTEHEGGVRAVEVEEQPLRANVLESRLRGTLIRWKPVSCNFRGCPNWANCFQNGLETDKEYVVKQTGALVTCPAGYTLRDVGLADV
ncbi:MAG TPA: UPF0179 family protein [Candidatus Thermoplasmatota archaeon]